jgi:hypothetical protein
MGWWLCKFGIHMYKCHVKQKSFQYNLKTVKGVRWTKHMYMWYLLKMFKNSYFCEMWKKTNHDRCVNKLCLRNIKTNGMMVHKHCCPQRHVILFLSVCLQKEYMVCLPNTSYSFQDRPLYRIFLYKPKVHLSWFLFSFTFHKSMS